MAKQGMKHYYTRHEKNSADHVPILSGKAKSGKTKANPLIPDGGGKVYHTAVFPAVDNDLAAENLLNDFDMTAADLQDLADT